MYFLQFQCENSWTVSSNLFKTVLYPGQNFWEPSLATSIIFRGPFGIFEGHDLMEKKKQTKNGLTIYFLFWTLQGSFIYT